MLMSINWHGECKIVILNIYAPNRASEHPRFWAEVEDAWQRSCWPIPNFMMGDFNLVKDPIGRAPRRTPNAAAAGALMAFWSHLGLFDEWCIENLSMQTFTFRMNVQATTPHNENKTPDLDGLTDDATPKGKEIPLYTGNSNNTLDDLHKDWRQLASI
jgi:hypothetical protein